MCHTYFLRRGFNPVAWLKWHRHAQNEGVLSYHHHHHIIIYIIPRTGIAVRCMNHTLTAPRCGTVFALHGAEIWEVGAAPSWFLSILLINWNDRRLCCTLGYQRISVRSCPCTHHVLGIRLGSGEEEDLDPGRSRITCWHVSWNSSSWSSSLWGPLPEQLCGAGSAPSPSPSRWSESAQNPCPKLLHRCPWRSGF